MATLNVTLNLDSKNVFSDELNFTATDVLSIAGKARRKVVETSTASAVV